MKNQQKIGRNDLCKCGSGKKYKYCCAVVPSVKMTEEEFATITQAIYAHRAEEEKRKRLYGEVRPIIYTKYKEHQIVAVGGEIHISPRWKTFPDFLSHYIFQVLGVEWCAGEIAKPLAERHQILQWYDAFAAVQRAIVLQSDTVYEFTPDGFTAAYFNLAYDLYILRDNQALQNELTRRLKIQDQFQGARYELFVTTVMTRAGFQIAFEDETDPTTSHAEFAATHKLNGQRLAVEAKSRHRPGVYGHAPTIERQNPETLKVGIYNLLKKAVVKSVSDPLAVFIDVNLPSEYGSDGNRWIAEIDADLEKLATQSGNTLPFCMAFFTNTPHAYSGSGQADQQKRHYLVPGDCAIKHLEVFEQIGQAISQYGNVPNAFPRE